MSRDVCVIPDDISIRDAARILIRNQISGAPVVDHRRALVGVVSSGDFVRRTVDHALLPGGRLEDVCGEWQQIDVDHLPEESVSRLMTTDVVTADIDELVPELARMMVDAHIHRVLIVDDHRAPIGIVTAGDILAAVARSARTWDRLNRNTVIR